MFGESYGGEIAGKVGGDLVQGWVVGPRENEGEGVCAEQGGREEQRLRTQGDMSCPASGTFPSARSEPDRPQ